MEDLSSCIRVCVRRCIYYNLGFGLLVDWKIFDAALGFLILGGLMLISGIYYALKILAFKTASSPEERQRVLNDIPID